jgi:hypothetical protein
MTFSSTDRNTRICSKCAAFIHFDCNGDFANYGSDVGEKKVGLRKIHIQRVDFARAGVAQEDG